MRWITYAVCLCAVAIQLSNAMPTPEEEEGAVRETLQTIDKQLGNPTAESGFREKRTIGIFRRIFPEISKMIDDKIQQLTSVIFRVVGSAVLRSGLGGGGGGGGSGNSSDSDSGRRVSIVLPTYPPEEYDEEEEEEEEGGNERSCGTRG
ncbi:UNVERIFIED_CONTAM: hypothetical protein PYX00_010776 [Menopon gallinae]|uniref:Uncharacterized protein n=1 Tax=Menopon gallinae TaxID=328185 RepID=A0AAW2HH75_9NEOP